MNASSLLYAILSIQRGGAVTAWEICSSLLQTLSPEDDVIAVTVPGSYTAMMLQERIALDHLFLHGYRPLAGSEMLPLLGEDGPLVILGDRDLELVPSLRVWPAVTSQTVARMRTIDTLYGNMCNPGLILIEDGGEVVPILSGAEETIRRHRPALIIGLGANPLAERTAIWEACVARLEEFGYLWVDGLLLPRITHEQRRDAVTVCANNIVCAVRPSTLEAGQPSNLPALLTDKADPIATIAWKDWVTRVPLDPQRAGHIVLPFDGRIRATGLHPVEHDDLGTWWQWSGPSAHARFSLPLPCAGQWRVRLEVLDWGVAGAATALQVFLQGELVRCSEFGEHFGSFGPVTIAPADAGGGLNVDVITPPPRSASDQDLRRIGVNFSRCVLERTA